MKKISGFLLNGMACYKFPEGIESIDELVEYLNKNYNSFARLEAFVAEGCVAPYFIEENLEIKSTYWNLAFIRNVEPVEIKILLRAEYEERLKQVVSQKCANCAHFVDYKEFESHFDKINLDGECFYYEPKK